MLWIFFAVLSITLDRPHVIPHSMAKGVGHDLLTWIVASESFFGLSNSLTTPHRIRTSSPSPVSPFSLTTGWKVCGATLFTAFDTRDDGGRGEIDMATSCVARQLSMMSRRGRLSAIGRFVRRWTPARDEMYQQWPIHQGKRAAEDTRSAFFVWAGKCLESLAGCRRGLYDIPFS